MTGRWRNFFTVYSVYGGVPHRTRPGKARAATAPVGYGWSLETALLPRRARGLPFHTNAFRAHSARR